MSNQNLLIASSKGGSSGGGSSGPTDVGFNYVAALFHGDGTNNSANNTSTASATNVLTKTGVVAEGTFTPYGSAWSNLFNGSNGYLSYAAGTNGSVGSNNFTAEAWINLTTLPANTGSAGGVVIIQKGYVGGSNLEWSLYLQQSGGNFQLAVVLTANGTTTQTFTSNNIGTVNLGTWYHCAITKSGTTLTFWFNGTSVSTASVPATFYIGSAAYTIGANTVGASPLFGGYISNARVVSGTVVYTSNFTPPTAPLTAISGTVLLVCQANSFADVSSLKSAVTVNGTVTVQRFNPFGDNGTVYSPSAYGGSAYFDGSTGFLQTPASTNYQFAGDFTIEAWVFPLSFSTSFLGYWTYGVATSCAFIFQTNSSGNLNFTYGIGGSNTAVVGTSTKLVTNAWNHIAVTRQGTTLRLYVNGVQDTTTGTASGSLNNSTQPLIIGANNNTSNNAAQAFYSGYMSDVRIVNGTALYTSSFTPNTAPLTAVTNTTLLYTAQSGGSIGIFDNSMQQNLQTVGQVQISNAQQKFGSGSLYFNNTVSNSVYPTIAVSASSPLYKQFNLASNDFTIEAWIYPTSTSTSLIMGVTKSGTNTDWQMYLNAGKLAFHWNASSDLTSTSSPTLNAWSHVAAVRSGSTLHLFLNGTQVGSASITGAVSFSTGDNFTIGADTSFTAQLFIGYMQEVRITNGVARYTANFSVPTTAFPNNLASDPYFNNVVCLVHGTGQNAYANNVYVATVPTTALSLTRTGTVAEGSFTPYGSNWSNFLSSTSTASYLTYGASTSASPGNQTFTIECWVMFDVLPTTTGSNGEFVLWQKGRSGTSNFELAWGVQYTGSGYQQLVQVSKGDGTTILSANSSNISITTGVWYHMAITQVSGSGVVNFWFNGQSAGSMSHTVTNMYIGTGAAAVGNNNVGTNPVWQGYVSNMRVVLGSQVYTTTFTPPTSPLTAITGTNFLGCQSGSFTDASSNNWTITPGGPMQVVRFNPFGDNATPYATATYGGSCYFAGSGSNLSYAANPIFGFGAGAFTIECWIYQTAYNSNNCDIVDLRVSANSTAMSIGIDSTGHLYYYDGPANVQTTATAVMATNAWYHVAVTRDGFGVWRAYINGVQVITTTGADNLGSSQPILIGQATNGTQYGFMGYISDFRITNGRALYTAAFTAPTAPLSQSVGVNFLYKAQGAAIYDNAMQQNVQTVGSAVISTSVNKFGTGSIYVSASTTDATSMIVAPASELPVWGTNNFTVEGWFNVTAYSGNSNGLFGQRASYTNYASMMAVIENGTLNTYVSNTAGTAWAFTINAGLVTTGGWFHYAFVRNGSTFTVYINGVSKGTGTLSTALLSNSAGLAIGASAVTIGSGNYSLNGYIDDFRITYGQARYTANFTPPTAAFGDK